MHDNSPLLQAKMSMKILTIEWDSAATKVSPPESSHFSSPLTQYSLFPDVFDEFVILAISLKTLYPYFVDLNFNMVQEDAVSRLEDEEIESIVHDLFNCKYFTGQAEDFITLNVQGNFPVDVSKFYIH